MLRNIAPRAGAGTVQIARRLRRSLSLPEGMLWRELRKRPGSLKFRRQHASGAYVLDFFCSDARLAIEVDGEAHGRGDRPTRDAVRDSYFEASGIKTLRIPAADVFSNLDAVISHILSEAMARLPLHHPSGGPPPPD